MKKQFIVFRMLDATFAFATGAHGRGKGQGLGVGRGSRGGRGRDRYCQYNYKTNHLLAKG